MATGGPGASLGKSSVASIPGHFVSVIVPAFNEAGSIVEHLARLAAYLNTLPAEYSWELIVIDDGSSDDTASEAERFAARSEHTFVIRHEKNFGLGHALRTGFEKARGDSIICIDVDLTYDPIHIEKLLAARQDAKIVLASPYMPGGRASNVPWIRKVLSVYANRLLKLVSSGRFSTFTGMVRLYDADFVKSIDIRSEGAEINLELLYRALRAGSSIAEIPAHLDWHHRNGDGRISLPRIWREIRFVLLYAYLFLFKKTTIPGGITANDYHSNTVPEHA